MSPTSEVVYKSNGVRVAGEATSMQLEGPATVKLGVDPQSVLRFERAGDDLVMVLKDGRKVTVSDFFAVDAQGQGSDLVLQGQDGVSWLGERTGTGADFHFTQLPAEAAPVAAASGAGAAGSSMPWVLAGLGGAGALALAAGGGGGDDSPAPAPANRLPTATAQALSTAEDTSASGTVVGSDPDGNTLVYRVSSLPANGTVTIDSGTGAYNYTPKANYHGTDSFAITVDDGRGGTATVTVPVTVTPVNDIPTVPNYSQTVAEDATLNGQVTGVDPDGQLLVHALATAPAHGAVGVKADGSYTYTPHVNFHGTDSFSVTVDDGNGGIATSVVTITVTSVNDAPVAQDHTHNIAEDNVLVRQVVATDVDGDPLTYSLGSAPSHGIVELAANGIYTYTPALNFNGTDTFTVNISDGKGGTTTSTVTINVTAVNDLPVVPETGYTFAEDTVLNARLAGLDADGDILTYTVESRPNYGWLQLEADGSFRYTPAENFNGTDYFTVKVSDGAGGTVSSTVSLTVTSVNDVPMAWVSSFLSFEDTKSSFYIATYDPDNDIPTFTVLYQPQFGTLELDPSTGVFSYIPKPNYNGPERFSVIVDDGHGGVVTVDVPFQVIPVNDAPTAPEQYTNATTEDTPVSGMFQASDIDGDDLIIYSYGPGSANGFLTVEANGRYIYAPSANFHGIETFTIAASDGHGGYAFSTLTVTVSPVNDVPVLLAAAPLQLEEDGWADGYVYLEDADNDTLTYTVITPPAHGTLTSSSDNGYYGYKPNPNFNGADSFQMQVDDGHGGIVVVTVPITVLPGNDPPTAEGLTFTIQEDTPLTGTVVGSDIDGDVLTYAIHLHPSYGTLSVSPGGMYVYTPQADFAGHDVFAISVHDGNGGVEYLPIDVHIESVNDAPVATVDPLVTEEGVAGNGQVSWTDVDGDAGTASIERGPSYGTLVLNMYSGEFTYTPIQGHTGSDSFEVRVEDGQGAYTLVTVPVTIQPAAADFMGAQSLLAPAGFADDFVFDSDGLEGAGLGSTGATSSGLALPALEDLLGAPLASDELLGGMFPSASAGPSLFMAGDSRVIDSGVTALHTNDPLDALEQHHHLSMV